MSDEGIHEGSHTVNFSQTTLTERLRNFASYLPREIPIFAAVTISFWGVAEVLSEVSGEAITLQALAAPALVTAFVVACYKAIQKFRAYVPEALAAESEGTKAIFRKGACAWQFALALQMLSERTEAYDRALSRIESGSHFSRPKRLGSDEYIEWLAGRPDVLLALIRAVAVQCVTEIPAVLATASERNLAEVRDYVSELAELYKETVDFELESRSVIPPSELSHVHEMTFGWTSPVRKGIKEFLGVLKSWSEITEREVKSGTNPQPFDITFDPPPNVDEFIRRLDSART